MNPLLRLTTLGTVRLEGGAGELLHGRRKELAFLAYMARRRRPTITRDELAALFWGERPDSNARQSLRQVLSSVKRALGDGLELDGDRVAIAAGVLELDAVEFERELSESRFAEALERYSGDFLRGLEDAGTTEFGAWVEGEREGLRVRAGSAFSQLVAGCTATGETQAARTWACRWAELFPFDERAETAAMLALQQLGHVDEARGRKAVFAARIRAELDIDPTPEFLALLEGSEPPPPHVSRRAGPGSRALFSPELVGRGEQITALTTAWSSALDGTATVVLVEGDEGCGKTRLCDEFIRRLPTSTTAFRARGLDTRRSVPWSLVRELFANLDTSPGLVGAGPAALATAGAILPALRERFPTALNAGGEPDLERAIAEVLSAVALETPVLLLVDDFPLADRESADLILSVMRRLRRAPVCFLLTADAGDAPQALLDEVQGRGDAVRVRLPSLAVAEVVSLVDSMLIMEPDELAEVADRVGSATEGNPLAVVETLVWLVDDGYLAPDTSGVWRLSGALPKHLEPARRAVTDSVRRHIAKLPDDARYVASGIAVLGVPASAHTLGALLGLPRSTVDSALEELLVSRVVRWSPTTSGHVEFYHDASRRAVYETIAARERRRLHAAAARLAPTRTDSESRIIRKYHRRRAGRFAQLTGSRMAMAASVVGLFIVAAYWWTGLRGAAGDFEARDWIVIADLDNATGDSLFDESLTAALFVSVSQSQFINVFPRVRMRETLQRMRRDSVQHVSEMLAREIAQREGLHAVVALGLTSLDGRFKLTARIVDPVTGASLATMSATAPDRQNILTALDTVAADLRRELGESARAVGERSTSLPSASTSSLEALKLFAAGSRAFDEGRTADGIEALRSAVALDSNFAWAHAMLGRYFTWVNDPEAARPHLQTALELTGRLPERERLLVLRLVAEGRRDRTEAVRLARAYLSEYPDDRDAWFALGRTLQDAGEREAALDAYRRTLEIDPHARSSLVNSALLLDLLGRPREAVIAFERAAAEDSTLITQISGDLNRIYGFALLRTGDSAGARVIFERLLQGDRNHQANGLRSLALFDAYYGRYGRAADQLLQAVQLSAAAQATVSELRNRLYLAGMYRTMGRADAARSQLRAASALLETRRLPSPWLGMLGQHQARLGMVADAERILDAIAAGDTTETNSRAALALVRGEIALAVGEPAAAIGLLEPALQLDGVNYVREALARAQVASARPTEAIATYQAILSDSALGWEVQEPWVLAHVQLANLHDAVGDSAAAVPLYERVGELWRDGDRDLPILIEVHRRLGRAKN